MKNNNCLLPKLVRKDSSMTASRQTVFGGLSSSPSATGQEIVRMVGLSPSAYPAIGTMESRLAYTTKITGDPHGMVFHKTLIVAQGTALCSVSSKGEVKILASIEDSHKGFASFGSRLFILPDGLCYDSDDGSILPLALDTGYLSDAILGTDYVTHVTTDWGGEGFAVGDGVEVLIQDYILGSVTTVSCKIKALINNTLFLDHTFDLTGTYHICVRRPFPTVTHLCAVGDRLMGCVGNRIYICEAGNPFNWCALENHDTDPASFETGNGGDFTACAAFQGTGVFFKEDHIYQLMGSGTDDYVLMDTEAPGVSGAGSRSLKEVDGILYYLAPGGVYDYEGDYPRYIGDPLPGGLLSGVGGSDGTCYYLSAKDFGGNAFVYAYHSNRNMWYVQDPLAVADMAKNGELLYIQTESGEILRTKRAGEVLPDHQTLITEALPALPSLVDFGEEFGGSPDGLRVHHLYLRVKGTGGALCVSVAYDGEDTWETVGVVNGAAEGMVHMRLYPRRAMSYRLRLSMTGQWLISEIYCLYEKGRL